MRAIAEAGKALGQKVLIENKPGAGGMLGANELVNARPDGYTLAQVPHGIRIRVPKAAADALKDFTWIACLTSSSASSCRPIRR
ncbi:MAG: tripartite tricarboxylate transporter substrate-binding protein [Rubrivivax sp.]